MLLNNTYKRIFILLLCFQGAAGQNYQFSQFYAAPTYLNPAFAGANVCSRVSLNYRNQWSGIPGTFTTYQVSADHTLTRYKSGIGIQVFKDKAGLGGLSTTQLNFLYAYETKINKRIMGRAGISAGSVQRSINLGDFTFGDQIARNDASTSLEGVSASSTRYLDLGVGCLVFARSAWAGFAASHINKPNQSLMNGFSPLPAELKFHGGYKHTFDETEGTKSVRDNHSITVAFNYKKQARFNQVDVGVYYNKDMLVVGCWYRGIPVFKPTKDYLNNDAIVFLFGLSIEKYKIGYSYDLTLSKLNNTRTKGTHELSMSFQFCKLRKPQKRKLILVSCPKF